MKDTTDLIVRVLKSNRSRTMARTALVRAIRWRDDWQEVLERMVVTGVVTVRQAKRTRRAGRPTTFYTLGL